MSMATLVVVATVLAGCGSSGDGSSGEQAAPPPPASFFGVVPQETLSTSDFGEMADAGVGTLRAGLYWQLVQPQPSGGYDFSQFDSLVRGATENEIQVLPFLFGSPAWVAQQFGTSGCTDCRLYAPQSPTALATWQLFAAKAAQRYGPGGEFWKENPDLTPMPIRTWQIWNEQNSKTFYLPKPDPVQYEKLLSSAAKGIRSQDPGATIVLGGMFGTPGGGDPKRSIAAATFLHDLLKIDGARDEFDGYALHPYSHTIRFVRKQVEIARRELSKSGYPDASLWVTEIGWSSGGSQKGPNVGNERAQAARLSSAYRLFFAHREDWNVKLVAWFAWQDSTASDAFCFFCANAGLLDSQGQPKAALDAYRGLAAGN